MKPFAIVNRYILLEMIPPFLVSLGFFTFIFLMKQILDITNLIVNYKVGLSSVALLMVFTMPYFLQYVIPMSVMMAVLLAFLRMSGDNEIVALKAGGVSVYRLIFPVLIFSIAGVFLTGFMTFYGLPKGRAAFKALLYEVATSNLDIGLKERTFNDSFTDVMLYVSKIDLKNKELKDILIEDKRTEGVKSTVVAPKGILYADPAGFVYYLRLFNGVIHQVEIKNLSSNSIRFNTYDIRLDFATRGAPYLNNQKHVKDLTLSELHRLVKNAKEKNERFYAAMIEYHKKFSMPFACLVMGLLAIPLGIQSRSAKRSFGFGLGLIFFLIYYMMLSVGTTFGKQGLYPAMAAMWVPNLVMGSTAAVLIVKTAREKQVDMLLMKDFIARIRRIFKNR